MAQMQFTKLYRTMNAVRFFQQQQFLTWVVLGRPDPWSGDYTDLNPPPPPAPEDDVTTIDTPICAVQALVLLVKPDPLLGPYEFRNAQGDIDLFSAYATAQDCIDDRGTRVMLRAQVYGLDLVTAGFNTFRQMGFATNLVPVSGHENDPFLPVENIESYGTLETISNSIPIPTLPDKVYTLSNIIEY